MWLPSFYSNAPTLVLLFSLALSAKPFGMGCKDAGTAIGAVGLKQLLFSGSMQLRFGFPSALPCHCEGNAPPLSIEARLEYECRLS